jgi:hypothetical protein
MIGIHTPESDYERDPKNVAAQVKQLGIKYPVLLDANGENWRKWNQQYWPTLYLIDKAGRVRGKWIGELAYNGAKGEAEVAAGIEKLLAENSSKPGKTMSQPTKKSPKPTRSGAPSYRPKPTTCCVKKARSGLSPTTAKPRKKASTNALAAARSCSRRMPNLIPARLALVLSAACRRRSGRRSGRQILHETHGNFVFALRWSSGPRLPRRPRAHRPALLHERRRA